MKTLITAALLLTSSVSAAEWHVKTSSNPMTDEVSTSALIMSESKKGALVIRCFNSSSLEFLIIPEHLIYEDQAAVGYRFDKQEPEEIRSTVSTTNKATFLDNGTQLAKRVAMANRMIIRTMDYKDTPHYNEFNLDGSLVAVKKVFKACGMEL